MALPDNIVECPSCNATGQDNYRPFVLGCRQCGVEANWPELGVGYLYKNGKPVPPSVSIQIANSLEGACRG